MFDSQVKITERLNTLNIDDEVKQFFLHVMEFYKNHIKKLQSIIMAKQEEVDESLQIKNGFEERVGDMQSEIERLHEELRARAEQENRNERRDLELTIQSLKDDLNTRLFDQGVYEDSIRNLKAQNESLKNQNSLLLTQLSAAKSEIAELRLKLTKSSNGPQMSDEIRREINNLRADLNNVKNATNSEANKTATSFYQKPTTSEVKVETAAPTVDKPKRFYNRGGQEEKPVTKEGALSGSLDKRPETARQKVYNDEDRPLDVGRGGAKDPTGGAAVKQQSKFDNMKKDEIEGYYKFLLEKEQELQNRMWKLPSKAKTKVEKQEISEVKRQLDELVLEIDEVKLVLKR